MQNNHIVRGYLLTLETPENRAAFIKELLGYLSEKRLPIEVTEFPLEKAAEAHQAIKA